MDAATAAADAAAAAASDARSDGHRSNGQKAATAATALPLDSWCCRCRLCTVMSRSRCRDGLRLCSAADSLLHATSVVSRHTTQLFRSLSVCQRPFTLHERTLQQVDNTAETIFFYAVRYECFPPFRDWRKTLGYGFVIRNAIHNSFVRTESTNFAGQRTTRTVIKVLII